MTDNNVWDTLITKQSDSPDPISLVIIFRHVDSLNSFQQHFNLQTSIDENEFIKYHHTNIENIQLDLYYCLYNDEINTIDLIKPLLKDTPTTQIHWLILLDWSIYDQQLWLKHIISCFDIIKEYSNKTLFVINTDHIYKIQQNVPIWYSFHIDYIQQTLRLYAMRNNADLIYTNSTSSQSLLQSLITHSFTNQDVEMAKTTTILIPNGHDSLPLIKTLDGNFNPEECTVTKYEQVIPVPVETVDLSMVKQINTVSMSITQPSINHPGLNEQQTLKDLQDYSRSLNK